jgi:hypothetical protein
MHALHCTAALRCSNLNLEFNQLNGTLPSTVGKLVNLQYALGACTTTA